MERRMQDGGIQTGPDLPDHTLAVEFVKPHSSESNWGYLGILPTGIKNSDYYMGCVYYGMQGK